MLRVPNPAFWWVDLGALVVLAVVLYVGRVRDLFRFSTLHPADLLVCVAGAAGAAAWFELLRWRARKEEPASG